MRRRFDIIFNPAGGRGYAPVRAELLGRLLCETGGEVVSLPTAAPGDARRHAAESDAELVVAVGGDGTISEVLNGLLDAGRETPLLVVPAGTANVVAATLELPENLPDLAALALEASPVRFDVGVLRGEGVDGGGFTPGERRFLMSAGAGLDAWVVRDLHARRRGPITYASYLGPLWRVWRRYEYPRLTLARDNGDAPDEATFVMLLNLPRYGGGLKPCPAACPEDGRMDALALAARGTRDWIRLAWKAWRGKMLRDKRVAWRIEPAFTITADRDTPLQVDGDMAGVIAPGAPVRVETLAGAARLLARTGTPDFP